MNENELEALRNRLIRAKELLREWQEKYAGRETHVFSVGGAVAGSASDLARETDLFLRGK